MPAKVPVSFFSSKSPVHDLFLGQLDHAEDIRRDSEVSLFYFYAPWCGQSVAVREEIEKVASSLADQVLFVAINCWWNQGKCRKQKQFFYFPVIYLYHRSFGPIEYKGPMNAVYIEKFVRRVMTPLLYISSQSKLQQFLSHYEPGVLGYFEFNASPQPPGYLTFFTSALHSLNKGDKWNKHLAQGLQKTLSQETGIPGLVAPEAQVEFVASLPTKQGKTPRAGCPPLCPGQRNRPAANSLCAAGTSDYLGSIHFGVITDKLIAKEIPLTISGSVYLHRHVNASLVSSSVSLLHLILAKRPRSDAPFHFWTPA
ncbi:hypothetical protein JD844_020134 [Phrynosoma platyrhinos]|uniref:Thioredoxin domain containing 11 n=1 Tax=Phrynosoma platyrhinos TaxID=52577 RepID=A0ABQ7TR17_PHRPL|nr:hypothetical protein JD844_020134 [Phrynosoma platyrhinos]